MRVIFIGSSEITIQRDEERANKFTRFDRAPIVGGIGNWIAPTPPVNSLGNKIVTSQRSEQLALTKRRSIGNIDIIE